VCIGGYNFLCVTGFIKFMSPTKTTVKQPFVSVVMPVRNEADFIERSLNAVLAQTFPHERMEIVIADGLSTDDTRKLIEQLKLTTDIPIKIVDNPKGIAPTGLNAAIARTKGEIIVRVDGHCEIAPDYVLNCVRHLQKGEAEAVGGPIETVGETATAQAIAVAMSSNFGVGGSAFRCVDDREMLVDTVAFPGYKREIFDRIGNFNEELVRNQDDEFSYRLRKSGGKILLAPDVRVRYYSRSNFKSLWRQYYQYGFWKVRVLQLHPKQMSLRQFVPFGFIITIIILAFISLFSPFGRWALAAVLMLYVLANLLATVKSAARVEFTSLPFVSLSFAILHFSYGFGFLAGLFAFRGRWREKSGEIATVKATV
jgi:succinoglycan biosynthesis protein ExoA